MHPILQRPFRIYPFFPSFQYKSEIKAALCLLALNARTLERVFIKWNFLIETLARIGSICERVTSDPDLSWIEQGNRRSRVLTPEIPSDRSSSDLISQRYNHPTNRIVRYPTRTPEKLHNCRSLSTAPFSPTYTQILPLSLSLSLFLSLSEKHTPSISPIHTEETILSISFDLLKYLKLDIETRVDG